MNAAARHPTPMIYLDHNATTPVDPEVRGVMTSCDAEVFGNPSSLHAAGQAARRIIDEARARLARLIGGEPDEIVFTGSGTEADNLALLGAAAAARPGHCRLAVSAIEHQGVLHPARHLAQQGADLVLLPVGCHGVLDLDAAVSACAAGPTLISVMLANNDTGVIQPVAALAAAARARGALLHTDAVQAVGKIPVRVRDLGVDLLSFSAHKLNGPKGVGALWVRRGVRLAPTAFGGKQERGLRPGTENVTGIAGFGAACDLAARRLEADARREAALRDWFETAVRERLPEVVVNGGEAPRLPNTSNLRFPGVDAGLLVINLDMQGVAASTGAACSAADREPSHVLVAMGQSAGDARSSVRFSIGRTTTREDLLAAADILCTVVRGMPKG